MNWDEVFENGIHRRERPATVNDLKALASDVTQPLSGAEVESVLAAQTNPFPSSHPLHATYTRLDPRHWSMPQRPLPWSYLDLLVWANGGSFACGQRQLDPLFSSA